MEYIIVCKCCGELFKAPSFHYSYCSDECRRKKRNKNGVAYQKENHGAVRYKASMKKNKKLTIQEICKRAKAEGLSYGKYVGKYGL